MKACVDAINRLGLQKGGGEWDFAGSDAQYWPKGCHVYEDFTYNGINYANRAYYGTGGSGDEVKESLAAPEYRPIGYDCSTGKSGNLI